MVSLHFGLDKCAVRAYFAHLTPALLLPQVLVLQLKRFEFSMLGHKLSKAVDYGTELDLAPYLSDRRAAPLPYDLYAVLVHAGHSLHSGHYYCYVRAPNGLWHRMDDRAVSQAWHRAWGQLQHDTSLAPGSIEVIDCGSRGRRIAQWGSLCYWATRSALLLVAVNVSCESCAE